MDKWKSIWIINFLVLPFRPEATDGGIVNIKMHARKKSESFTMSSQIN